MRRETNADVLQGGVECPDPVVFSVYDTKPVIFLSMEFENLVWNINEQDIYDKATKKKVKFQLYCTELNVLIKIT